MKKWLFLIIAGVMLIACCPQENPNSQDTLPDGTTGTFTDARDGNVYQTVKIGSQIWMAEDLKFLPSVNKPIDGSKTEPYYYVYGYDGSCVEEAKAFTYEDVNIYETYGVLYNWAAATTTIDSDGVLPVGTKATAQGQVQGVCPDGWHLPSKAEWVQLECYLADNGHNYDGSIGWEENKFKIIGKSMATDYGWKSSEEEGAVGNDDCPEYKNKSGFSALPSGSRFDYGTFGDLGIHVSWWSATEYKVFDFNYDHAWLWYLQNSYNILFYNYWRKDEGLSVRCVKD
ncbi:MAG: hypothetical protein GX877_00455 [Bacteroidales bacterium]|nr:hypothetical protein [Bacteroidales bacterium]